MIRIPPSYKRTATLVPYATLFRSAPRRDDRLPIIIHDDVRGMSQLPPTRRSSAASAATRQCRTRFRIPTEPWDEKADDAWTGPSEPGPARDSGSEGADDDPEHEEREIGSASCRGRGWQ